MSHTYTAYFHESGTRKGVAMATVMAASTVQDLKRNFER
jgi:hypothetical protein